MQDFSLGDSFASVWGIKTNSRKITETKKVEATSYQLRLKEFVMQSVKANCKL